ncbi:uncharacterized protein PHACADRAFT_254844 [Phanerochaete carnosa HHB-10118-sp]|uniref:Uncharacterized protein n=1 Tax=Phanerochaete carnosa (strain HHB-10118-sp) TaxID=650164 RepID=K5X319_PHACS|nr:uncharacterized protein PHACADRAFT_254844 [Phanerochaete carnosa HHB-10118-sp]EKM57202.1 hypothetical protein PHACADRAFT_254844 [Phanerochaete carnosa HHB-10118-sp]
MEDVISHEQELTFTRWTITVPDLAKWPDAAGRLEDGSVSTDSSKAETRSLKSKQIVFTDSRDPSCHCLRFALSADDKLPVASFGRSDVLVWRLSDGLLVQLLHRPGRLYEVLGLSFSPIDFNLASGSRDGTATVWDTRHGRILLHLEDHGGPVSSIAHAPNGAVIATDPHKDKSVKIWNASSGVCLHSFGANEVVYKLAFSPRDN